MKSSESLNEFEIIRILINAVDEIENYTKEIGSTVLEKPIGFFFSRVIDNRITIQEKYQREYELAVNRAAAFVIVIQLFFYVFFAKKRVRTRLIESSSLTT
ncbi:MAG: hypothetical protein ACXACU_15990, partial [Candidatus Hodarchaeales archaeon]